MKKKKKRRALGKGLSTLIASGKDIKIEEVVDKTKALDLNINNIKPNPEQIRKNINVNNLKELAESIKEKGVLQPIIVRKKDNKGEYELITGNRRLKAVTALHLPSIPVIIKDVSNEEAFIISIMENLQRDDLDPIEEASSYKRLMDKFNLTQENVAKKIGKDRATIANMLRLLTLPDDIRENVSRGTIYMGHARALLGLKDAKIQRKLCKEIVKKGLNVRQVEKAVDIITRGGGIKEKKGPEQADPHAKEIENKLSRVFGTKIKVIDRGKKGKIEIEFYSYDDLDRILEILLK